MLIDHFNPNRLTLLEMPQVCDRPALSVANLSPFRTSRCAVQSAHGNSDADMAGAFCITQTMLRHTERGRDGNGTSSTMGLGS
jgi:hypothetical protein